MKPFLISLLVLLCGLFSGPDRGFGGSSLKLTVTNQNLALVREIRALKIPTGEAVEVVVDNIPQSVDSRSLQAESLTAPERFRIRTTYYRHNLATASRLLDRYLGKPLQVVLRDPARPDGALLTRDATLLANSERAVFAMDGKVYIGEYVAVRLPEVPVGLRARPSFLWVVDNRCEETQQVSISYLVGELGWDAAYTLRLNEGTESALLEGWAVVRNQSGRDYPDAELNLMAGKLRLAVRPTAPRNRGQAGLMAVAASPERAQRIQPASAFEYYRYRVPGTVDVPDGGEAQIALVHARVEPVVKELVSRGRVPGNYRVRADRGEQPQDVEIHLKFRNRQADGLGLPLPAGDVRVFQRLTDGEMILVGEDRVPHTAVSADVDLAVGSAFDCKVKRKLLGFEKVGKNVLRTKWELQASNGKDRRQDLSLEESFPGEWKILSTSDPYEQIDAQSVRFKITVPGKSKKSVRYLVEINPS